MSFVRLPKLRVHKEGHLHPGEVHVNLLISGVCKVFCSPSRIHIHMDIRCKKKNSCGTALALSKPRFELGVWDGESGGL